MLTGDPEILALPRDVVRTIRQHLPNAAGVNADGRQNNWWKYVADYVSYAESR